MQRNREHRPAGQSRELGGNCRRNLVGLSADQGKETEPRATICTMLRLQTIRGSYTTDLGVAKDEKTPGFYVGAMKPWEMVAMM